MAPCKGNAEALYWNCASIMARFFRFATKDFLLSNVSGRTHRRASDISMNFRGGYFWKAKAINNMESDDYAEPFVVSTEQAG